MMPRAVLAFAGAAGLMFTGGVAADPCQPSWVSLGENGGLATIRCMTAWDPDGPGPAPSSVIAGLSYSTIIGDFITQHVVRWTGERWESLGSELAADVLAATSWDPDGDGPSAPWLVVGGNGFGIRAFDGQSWFSLGGAFDNDVHQLLTWDADGNGPASPVLIAGGDFTSIGGQPVMSVAQWTGTEWIQIGGGLAFPARAMTTWDSDGDDSTAPVLVAGSSKLRIFNGIAWTMLDATDDDSPFALTTWDEDGSGPNPPVLYAGGIFDTTTTRKQFFVRWTGAAWEQLGVPVSGTPQIKQLIACDPDGPGPAPEGVFVGSSTNRECYFWDGSVLRDWDAGVQSPVYASIHHDPDGSGPLTERLIIGGGSNSNFPVWRNSYGWEPLGSGLRGIASRFAFWDPDGDGPEPETVFAGGTINRGTLSGLAMLRNGKWEQLGAGPAPQANPSDQSLTYTLVPWRGGPSPHSTGVLVAYAQIIPASLGIPANSLPLWDGAAWSSIPFPTGGFGTTTTWDPDGPGPEPELLIIANATDVFAHDGAAWSSLSTQSVAVKSTAISWDPDGDGPDTPILISAAASGGYVQRTTADWSPMPAAFSASVVSITKCDPDADGPEPAWLLALRSTGGDPTRYEVVRWDGATWNAITSEVIPSSYTRLTLWDPDSNGSGLPQVVLATGVTIPGDPTTYHAITFTGAEWQSLGTFTSINPSIISVRAVFGLPKDIPGVNAGSLFVGGDFEVVDTVRSLNTAILHACAPEPCDADLDNDGQTGPADFVVLAEHYGTETGATRAQGDLNGDGAVNSADFVILAGDFGCASPN